MTTTVTGEFQDVDAARNALDELISAGFDREKVFLEEEDARLKVLIPASAEGEVREILNRHEPREVTAH